MTHRRRKLGAVMVAVFMIGSLSPGGTRAADPEELAEDLKFRREFGLETSIAAVSAIRSADNSSAEFGVPLTPSELADLNGRLAAEPVIARLQETLRQTVPSFGGLSIDQAAGGVVEVAFTDDPEKYQPLIRGILDSVEVRLRRVTNTESVLIELNEFVTHDHAFHASAGTRVNEAYPDPRTNSVQIGIEPYSEDIAKTLESRYGGAIEVYYAQRGSTTACSSRDNCSGPPLRAGLHL